MKNVKLITCTPLIVLGRGLNARVSRGLACKRSESRRLLSCGSSYPERSFRVCCARALNMCIRCIIRVKCPLERCLWEETRKDTGGAACKPRLRPLAETRLAALRLAESWAQGADPSPRDPAGSRPHNPHPPQKIKLSKQPEQEVKHGYSSISARQGGHCWRGPRGYRVGQTARAEGSRRTCKAACTCDLAPQRHSLTASACWLCALPLCACVSALHAMRRAVVAVSRAGDAR